jgi:transcriptional regulator with XRE-family HTH domain
MDASAWPEENWAVLGEQIAKARRAKGWDQPELARQSGNSPNTISNYERGRATRSRRVPSGLVRVARALGWPPDAAQAILAGENPDVALYQQPLFDFAGEPGGKATVTPPAMPGFMSSRDIELTQSGHVAQDTFIRQMKRYRRLLNVSIEELAERVAELGADIELKDLMRLENGTRLLRMSEAKALARALDTTVDWLLGSGFSNDAPDEMKIPPTDEELQAEAKAVERRISELGEQVNRAHSEYAYARQRAEDARQQAEQQMAVYQQVASQQVDLERQYHYLLGRIDSLRAAKGEEQIIQMHLVTEREGETVGERLSRAREEAEMTAEDVFLLTRIRPNILEAIENDDFSAAAGGETNRDVYARGHIRVLARAFGLDPAPLLAQYDVEHGGRPAPGPQAPLFTADSGVKPRRRVLRGGKQTDEDQ